MLPVWSRTRLVVCEFSFANSQISSTQRTGICNISWIEKRNQQVQKGMMKLLDKEIKICSIYIIQIHPCIIKEGITVEKVGI